MTYKLPYARTKDTKFLGWVIGVCSAAFMISLMFVSSETTHMANFDPTVEATTPTPR